jgi:hypothetical protein
MLFNNLPLELLLKLSEYLLEPQIYITNIGWNKSKKYKITYSKKEFNKKLDYYINIIKYQIKYFIINDIFSLYEIIYNYNKAFRKFNPTYIFIDKIFQKYKFLSYSDFLNLEYSTNLNISKLEYKLETIHTFSINNSYICLLKELQFFIKKYNKFTNKYIFDDNNFNYYFLYPFHMYLLDILPFYH